MSVNGVKAMKGQPVKLKHGDLVVLSDLPKLYSWKFHLDNLPAKKKKLEQVSQQKFGGQQELVNRISQQRKDHEVIYIPTRISGKNGLS